MIQEHWDKGVAVTCQDHKIIYEPAKGCPLCKRKDSGSFRVPIGPPPTPVNKVEPVGFKLDAGKPRIGLVLREVPHAIEKLGTVLGFGAEKYSIGNWKNLEDIEGRFLDSMMRHLTAYHKGEKVDPESGESHLAHAFFNLAILLEQEQRQ